MSESAEQRFYRLVGARIRKDRKAAGITLLEFSHDTGLSTGFLCDLENGKRGVSAFNLAVICDSLAWGVGEFLKAAGA